MSKIIINSNSSTIVLMLIFLASGTFLGIANAQNLTETSAATTNKNLSFSELYELVKNSIVQVTKTTPPADPLGPNKENQTSLGTGFIYNNSGYIITNNHVVENIPVVDITFINGDRYTANITGTDRFSDLAVIKINENVTQNFLNPLVIGNSSKLKVGDPVVAIGHPFGLESSMTTGIISQIGRLLSVDEKGFSIPNAIQTDALINPGNSGGPLLNMKGEVIGVNTAGIFPGNIGLAVPSDTVLRIIPVLIEGKNYTHPWLGVTGTTLTADLAKREKVDRSQKGVLIDNIVKDGPADLAGLNGSTVNQYGEKRGGDLITAIDGKQIIKMEDLISYLELNKSVNENATLSIYRDGETLDKQITLKSRPTAPETNQTQN